MNILDNFYDISPSTKFKVCFAVICSYTRTEDIVESDINYTGLPTNRSWGS